MALKIGFGGMFLLVIVLGVMWYVNRKKRKVAEAKLAECQGSETE